MARFHVNDDGEAKPCDADVKECRFSSTGHYGSADGARAAYETRMENMAITETGEKYSALKRPTFVKDKSKDKSNEEEKPVVVSTSNEEPVVMRETQNDGLADDEAGDVETPFGYRYRVGNRIGVVDNGGFVAVHTYENEAQAKTMIEEYKKEHAKWLAIEEEYSDNLKEKSDGKRPNTYRPSDVETEISASSVGEKLQGTDGRKGKKQNTYSSHDVEELKEKVGTLENEIKTLKDENADLEERLGEAESGEDW